MNPEEEYWIRAFIGELVIIPVDPGGRPEDLRETLAECAAKADRLKNLEASLYQEWCTASEGCRRNASEPLDSRGASIDRNDGNAQVERELDGMSSLLDAVRDARAELTDIAEEVRTLLLTAG